MENRDRRRSERRRHIEEEYVIGAVVVIDLKWVRVSLCTSCLVSNEVNTCFVMRFVSLLATSSFATRYALRVSARTKWVHVSFWASKLWLKASIPNADFSGRIPFPNTPGKLKRQNFLTFISSRLSFRFYRTIFDKHKAPASYFFLESDNRYRKHSFFCSVMFLFTARIFTTKYGVKYTNLLSWFPGTRVPFLATRVKQEIKFLFYTQITCLLYPLD